MLEILLLQSGFHAIFHQSEYGRFYEDAILEPQTIAEFKPDLIYLHTCALNVRKFPSPSCTEQELQTAVGDELNRYRSIWKSLGETAGCQIIQNNFELPAAAILGNLDAVCAGGRTRFIHELNRQFAIEAAANPRLILQDLASISARVGLDRWFDPKRWYSYKIANTVAGSFAIASSLAALVRSVYGRARKVLVLDLDNTLWGGVIGDDGLDKIVLGRETPVAEAYTAFQETASHCARAEFCWPSAQKTTKRLPGRDLRILTPFRSWNTSLPSRRTGSRSTRISCDRQRAQPGSRQLCFCR